MATGWGGESNKYDMENYTFPEDLFGAGAAKYGNSWVMININSQENSKYISGQSKYTGVVDNKRNTNFDNLPEMSGNKAAAITATTGAVAGGAAAGGADLIGKFIMGRGKVNPVDVGKVAAGAGKGLAAGAFAAAPFIGNSINRKTQRITTAIALPMPNQLSTGYTASWDEDSTALMNAALRIGGQATSTGISGAFREGPDAVVAASLATQSVFGSKGASAMTGIAYNPKKELIFNGVGFRNFSLDYKLYPRSRREQAQIYAIIYALKFHMHPEYKSEGRYTFIYPSEFDIAFFNADTENVWVNKIATSVLKNMTVNYTPDGLWAQHDTMGAPNAINISLQFQELSIITKETVEKGF